MSTIETEPAAWSFEVTTPEMDGWMETITREHPERVAESVYAGHEFEWREPVPLVPASADGWEADGQ